MDEYVMMKLIDNTVEYFATVRDRLSIFGIVCGSYVAVKLCCRLLQATRTYLIPIFWYEKDFVKRYGGKWAVVTGASDGLGRAYATALARRKLKVLLISRSESKLKKLAAEITSNYQVETNFLALDLKNISDEAVFNKIKKEVESLDVALLVNNVGTCHSSAYFKDLDRTKIIDVVELNTKPMIAMSHMILPQMIARHRGAIINVSSLCSTYPAPLYLSVYGATKSFVDKFTLAIEYENRCHNITMQAVQPGFVSTPLLRNPPANFSVADAKVFAESALRTLGVVTLTCGYWKHALFWCLQAFPPEWVTMLGLYYLFPSYGNYNVTNFCENP